MFAATSIQQSVAYGIVLILTLGIIFWLLGNVRKARPEVGSEVELAANRRPYFDDEGMEGKRLDNVLRWALISLTIVAVGLPLYWLAEPGRQSGAISNFKEVFASRGSELYATTAEGGFNCAGCHGGVSGGQVAYTLTDPITGDLSQVTWKAPSLDDVTLRMTDEQITEVLTYGRPFSPMPAWGLEGGGPMNEQQISNLVEYLHSVDIGREAARKRATENADEELKRLQDPQSALDEARATLETTTVDADRVKVESTITELEAIIASGQPATEGAAVFNTQCARCHTLGWSYYQPLEPGSGAFGPPLTNEVNQFPNKEDQVDFVTNGRKFGEKYGRQGKASGRMPYYSQLLTKEQIEAVVDYERTLGSQPQEQ
jgi:mono/diheme cytochrome c family protein